MGDFVSDGEDLTQAQRIETTLNWFLVAAIPCVVGAHKALKATKAEGQTPSLRM